MNAAVEQLARTASSYTVHFLFEAADAAAATAEGRRHISAANHLTVLSVLGVSPQSLATFWTLLLISVSHQEARNFYFWPGGEREPLKNASSWLCRRDLLVGDRQEAMKEAPMSGAWRQTGLHGVYAVPTPCVTPRLPRPVQTGGGHSATPSSTQLVSLGRLLLFG